MWQLPPACSYSPGNGAGLTDVLSAGVAVLGVERLEAVTAVGSALPHDVTLPPQHGLTLEAAEVTHVPVATLRLRALVRKDDLQGVGEACR